VFLQNCGGELSIGNSALAPIKLRTHRHRTSAPINDRGRIIPQPFPDGSIGAGRPTELRNPAGDKAVLRIMIKELLRRIIDPYSIQPDRASLHLKLAEVYPRVVIEKYSGEAGVNSSPVEV
jgi:hypothetical protein